MRVSVLPVRSCTAVLLAAWCWTTPPLHAQSPGTYLNVESPQVSPLALTTVAGRTLLLVCNTPDNMLELWDTNEAIPIAARQLHRLRVGLEPASVHVAGDKFWTANFLGDSVTRGKVEVVNNQPHLRFETTANVGDEPMDLAFDATSNTLFVSLHTSSALVRLHADTLAVVANLPLIQNPDPTPANAPWGLKEPRAVRVQGGRVYALGLKGGVTHALSTHDLDVLSAAIGPTMSFNAGIAGLGSTNFNGRFDSRGDLWVVGGEAKNFDNDDKIAVRMEPTGFVQSTLYRVKAPAGTASISRRDVNTRPNGTMVAKSVAVAAPTDLALFEQGNAVRKVFVAGFSSDRIGVFAVPNPIPVGNPLTSWARRTIGYTTVVPPNGNPRFGPRGLVLGNNQSGVPRLYVLNRLDNSLSIFDPVAESEVESVELPDPTPSHVRHGRQFLYSADISGNGFVSCSSCHTDGRTDARSWKLGNPNNVPPLDPPPDLNFVFGLAGVGIAGDPLFYLDMLFDEDGMGGLIPNPTFNPPAVLGNPNPPPDKREMITQSLQGLSNFEVEFHPGVDATHAQVVRTLFHNAPFHWRGDKPSLRDFNEAFATLLHPQGTGTLLTDAQMDQFEEFVHSITYPPNPQQPQDRRFSADDPNHPVYGPMFGGFAGGLAGLEEFHTIETVLGNRACVHCHSLPVGSNRRLTDFVNDATPISGYIATPNRQPIETAAMRGLLQKEPLLEPDGNFPNTTATTPILGHFGLNHNGILRFTSAQNLHTSINLFVNAFFSNDTSYAARALKQFCHEIDWGVAPMVGKVVVVPQTALGTGGMAAIQAEITKMEIQAKEANASLVVWGSYPAQATTARGFRYYPPSAIYVEEPSLALLNASALAATLVNPDDSLTFLSVPLGSERRIAAPTGAPGAYLQQTPSNVVLLPMTPNVAYAGVPAIRDNWVPATAPTAILGAAQPFNFTFPNGMDDVFAKAVRLYQYGLLDGQNLNSYGLPQLRHEAPRRLRVSGGNLVTGCKLLLSVPFPTLPYAGSPPSTPQGQASIPTVTLELPLYPTDDVDPSNSNRPVWETAVELEPIWAYTLMLGGPRAPGVQDTVDYVNCSEMTNATVGSFTFCGQFGLPNPVPVTEPTAAQPNFQSPYAPDLWNWHKVQVRNPGVNGPSDPTGMISNAVWMQLRM